LRCAALPVDGWLQTAPVRMEAELPAGQGGGAPGRLPAACGRETSSGERQRLLAGCIYPVSCPGVGSGAAATIGTGRKGGCREEQRRHCNAGL
jgi:hypothetical protein